MLRFLTRLGFLAVCICLVASGGCGPNTSSRQLPDNGEPVVMEDSDGADSAE